MAKLEGKVCAGMSHFHFGLIDFLSLKGLILCTVFVDMWPFLYILLTLYNIYIKKDYILLL